MQIQENLALVSVVGDGLLGPDSYAGAFLDVLKSVHATCIQSVGSPLRLSAAIEAGKLDDAQRALHAAMIA